jgi:predicted nucleotidyltransferase
MATDPAFKTQILEALHQALEKEEKIVSAWVGGSTATGYEDEISDIDIVAICESPELVFQKAESTLLSRWKIQQIWKVEDSIFKGFQQKFYILEKTHETFYVDFGVFVSLSPEDYQEQYNKARHGTPVVLFDKTGILKEASRNPKMVSPPDYGENFMARFEVLYRTFLKESLRGKFIDSHLFYSRLVLMLIQLMRAQHSPQRFDFGFRYIERDLPAAEAHLINELLRISDLETMQKNAKRIKALTLDYLNLRKEKK